MNKIQKITHQLKVLEMTLRSMILKQKCTIPNLKAPKHIVLHHGGGWMNFKKVNEYHKKKWGFKSSLGYYVGYQYFIERTGRVFQARADNEESAHCVEPDNPGYWNKNSIGVCLMGNGQERPFTFYQLLSLQQLLKQKQAQYNIPNSEIYGHREIDKTICPSDKAFTWLAGYRMGLAK